MLSEPIEDVKDWLNPCNVALWLVSGSDGMIGNSLLTPQLVVFLSGCSVLV